VLRPNPPRLITLALAVVLVVIGVSATIFPIDFVSEALALVQAEAGTAIEVTPEIGLALPPRGQPAPDRRLAAPRNLTDEVLIAGIVFRGL
jgi:hypothetical protein